MTEDKKIPAKYQKTEGRRRLVNLMRDRDSAARQEEFFNYITAKPSELTHFTDHIHPYYLYKAVSLIKVAMDDKGKKTRHDVIKKLKPEPDNKALWIAIASNFAEQGMPFSELPEALQTKDFLFDFFNYYRENHFGSDSFPERLCNGAILEISAEHRKDKDIRKFLFLRNKSLEMYRLDAKDDSAEEMESIGREFSLTPEEIQNLIDSKNRLKFMYELLGLEDLYAEAEDKEHAIGSYLTELRMDYSQEIKTKFGNYHTL